MKSRYWLMIGILAVIVVSGCIEESPQFTEDNFQFLSLDYSGELDLNIWKSTAEWVNHTCNLCLTGKAYSPGHGEEIVCNDFLDQYPGWDGWIQTSCSCSIGMKYLVNIILPEGYDNVNCKIYLNGEDVTCASGDQCWLRFEEGVTEENIAIVYGSRIYEDNTVRICCEEVCKSKTLPGACINPQLCSGTDLIINGAVYDSDNQALELTISNNGDYLSNIYVILSYPGFNEQHSFIMNSLSSMEYFSISNVMSNLQRISVYSSQCYQAMDILDRQYIIGLGS